MVGGFSWCPQRCSVAQFTCCQKKRTQPHEKGSVGVPNDARWVTHTMLGYLHTVSTSDPL